MSIATGHALAMRLQLRRLMQRHRVQNEFCKIPLSEPTDHPMILEGYASTDDLDLDRVKMRPYAFGFPMRRQTRDVPLLYKHDPNQVAGKISDLEYDDFGSLCVWCTVTHPEAKRCGAFSIAATVIDYEIINGDTPDFYAIIKSAGLNEISLTDTPSNPFALVMDRYRVSPAVQTLELLTAKMKCLQQMVALIQKEVHP
jgi:phage head maturation protease